jgi:hypothetical protein
MASDAKGGPRRSLPRALLGSISAIGAACLLSSCRQAGVLIVTLVVSRSLWIMANLNVDMMPASAIMEMQR